MLDGIGGADELTSSSTSTTASYPGADISSRFAVGSYELGEATLVDFGMVRGEMGALPACCVAGCSCDEARDRLSYFNGWRRHPARRFTEQRPRVG